MCRAYGSLARAERVYNGLKSVVTKWVEPTALGKELELLIKDYAQHPLENTLLQKDSSLRLFKDQKMIYL